MKNGHRWRLEHVWGCRGLPNKQTFWRWRICLPAFKFKASACPSGITRLWEWNTVILVGLGVTSPYNPTRDEFSNIIYASPKCVSTGSRLEIKICVWNQSVISKCQIFDMYVNNKQESQLIEVAQVKAQSGCTRKFPGSRFSPKEADEVPWSTPFGQFGL